MISQESVDAIESAAGFASAYVHIPFCARVCPYCDFTVVAGRDDVVDRYLIALAADIASMPPWRQLDAVFIGGGTPSRIGADRVGLVVAAIDDVHGLASCAEVTIEANPEDIDQASAVAFREVGVTRISLGVQSFDDAVLAVLGREHDAARGTAAVEAAQGAGFDSVSVDLIFGHPMETEGSWASSVQQAIDLGVDHVSTYSLTVEPGTDLWREVRRGATEPDPDDQADRWQAAESMLSAAGFERYEVSNHARPGHHCRYNAAVWAQADYLAFGVGAHGFRDGIRTANVRRLDTYLERVEAGIGPVQTADPVDGWAAEQERLMLGLRRAGGVLMGVGGEALLASDEGKALVEHGVIGVERGRLVVRRPLFTDAVVRDLLGVDPPARMDPDV